MFPARRSAALIVRGDSISGYSIEPIESALASAWNHRADHLVAQTIRVYDGAAFERLHHARNAHCSRSLIHCYFGKGCHIAALLVAARDSESLPLLRFLARQPNDFALSPAPRADADRKDFSFGNRAGYIRNARQRIHVVRARNDRVAASPR